MRPFFTIITATFNAAGHLPRLLDSLASQTCRDFELVIQDGGSTDATAHLAEDFRNRLPFLSFVSEPDSGIYDAWNKALARARGEWVLFLGADDTLAENATLAQSKALAETYPDEVVFAAGDLLLCLSDGTILQAIQAQTQGGAASLREGIPVPYPALFTRRTVFQHMRFNTDFRIAADYEFLCRSWKHDAQARSLGLTITRMYWGGVSSHPRTAFTLRREDARAAGMHFSHTMTPRRIRSLVQGAVITGCCILFGPRRTGLWLDKLRVLRGLPPCWGSGIGNG